MTKCSPLPLCALLACFMVLTSCEEDEPGTKIEQKVIAPDSTDTAQKAFVADTTVLPYNFPKTFPNDSIVRILEGLKICNVSDPLLPERYIPCEAPIFRILPISAEAELDRAFVVEIWEGVFTPTRQILTLVNKDGKWVITNRMGGQVFGTATSPTGVYDLLVMHDDISLGMPPYSIVMVKHTWIGDRFAPKQVFHVGGYDITPEQQDSVNAHYLNEFPWGE